MKTTATCINKGKFRSLEVGKTYKVVVNAYCVFVFSSPNVIYIKSARFNKMFKIETAHI